MMGRRQLGLSLLQHGFSGPNAIRRSQARRHQLGWCGFAARMECGRLGEPSLPVGAAYGFGRGVSTSSGLDATTEGCVPRGCCGRM